MAQRDLRRGDVVTVAAGGGFGGKPRPALVVQSDGFTELPTVVVALFTSTLVEASLIRPRFAPDANNGLLLVSDLMADILVTVRRNQVGEVIGSLSVSELARAEQALLLLMGFARA